LHYASNGVRLGLLGRDAARLADTAAHAAEKGAVCDVASADVTDASAIGKVLQEFDARQPIDLLIVNAGILDGRRQGEAAETAETARRVIETNLTGALNTFHAVLPAMQARRGGQIAIISSLSAFAPLADAPAYAASKAALLSYGLAMREALAGVGVKINVATPGYVATAMTEVHKGAHPFKISPEDAARRIANGLDRNRAVIAFPLPLYLATRFAQLLPDVLRRAGNRGLRFHVTDARNTGASR
ncbi:MAG: SDR family NAD(P)-dependent oxidoreductase, partial [Beijerinckiaceae bacterium]|nr:SDR family NAD(P)-dependent oxidoreductase [Beijerinckiaceae bacterium]